MPNCNCLEGMKCPNCDSEEPFAIDTSCEATVFDNGVEETCDHWWNDDSYCKCMNCSYAGKVVDFMTKN